MDLGRLTYLENAMCIGRHGDQQGGCGDELHDNNGSEVRYVRDTLPVNRKLPRG